MATNPNNVSFAGFYDWSIDELGEVSISNIYRKIANNPRNKLNRSKNWCQDGIHLVPGRMFLRDKAALTKGEKEIIYGIYKNRGDVQRDANEINHVRSHRDAWLIGKPVSKKDGKSDSETCAIKVPDHLFSKQSPRNTKFPSSPRSVCYMCTKNKEKCEIHNGASANTDTKAGRIAPPTSPLQSPRARAVNTTGNTETPARTVDKDVNDAPRIVPRMCSETPLVVSKTHNETPRTLSKTHNETSVPKSYNDSHITIPKTYNEMTPNVSKTYNEMTPNVSKTYNEMTPNVSKTYNEMTPNVSKSYDTSITMSKSLNETPRNVFKPQNDHTGAVSKSHNETPRRAIMKKIVETPRPVSKTHTETSTRNTIDKPSSGKIEFQRRTAHGAVFVETGRTFFDPKAMENKKKLFVNVFLPKIATQMSTLDESTRTFIQVQSVESKDSAPRVIKTGNMDTTIMDKVPRISAVCSRET